MTLTRQIEKNLQGDYVVSQAIQSRQSPTIQKVAAVPDAISKQLLSNTIVLFSNKCIFQVERIWLQNKRIKDKLMTSEWPTTMCVANWRMVDIILVHNKTSSPLTLYSIIGSCSSSWIELNREGGGGRRPRKQTNGTKWMTYFVDKDLMKLFAAIIKALLCLWMLFGKKKYLFICPFLSGVVSDSLSLSMQLTVRAYSW